MAAGQDPAYQLAAVRCRSLTFAGKDYPLSEIAIWRKEFSKDPHLDRKYVTA
jgi:hypothetical protein